MIFESETRLPALAFRASGVLASVLLLLLAWQEGTARAAAAAAVDELVAGTGLGARSPEVARRARREPDPYWGRLAVARALVAEAVDPSPFSSLPPRQAALELGRVGDRLELARRLAAAAAEERPAVWQAPMLTGAVAYLELSRAGSPALFTDRAAWRVPLERAAALAPGSAEPARFMAAADLETWRVLGPSERRVARDAIASAFADPATFTRLAGLWLEVAESRDTAFALVPDHAQSWRVVERWAGRRRDWETYCAAAEREDVALNADAAAGLAEIEARVAGGDPPGARTRVLSLLALAPPDRALAEVAGRALALCPPGPATPTSTRAFTPWLDWELDGFARGLELLPPPAVGRLLEGAGRLDAPDRALALLAAGRLAEAEALDRRAEDLNTERWAPYGLAKARVLADRGEADGARAALRLVHPAWRDLPQAQRLAVRLGIDDTPPVPAVSWSATAWRWHSGTPCLDALPSEPATALAIAISAAPSDGAVAEVTVGFRRAWRGAVAAGDTIFVPVAPGDSLTGRLAAADDPLVVTLRGAAGGRVTPGTVRLVEAGP